RLDIMVANAGIGIMSPIAEMTLADWQRQQAINLDGVFLSIKHAIPAMKKVGGGSIVLMSSIAGLRGAPGLAAYSATKGGVRLLAKSVALEHAADNTRPRRFVAHVMAYVVRLAACFDDALDDSLAQ
ncbi:MAG TPA: SDR family NAD(P)-dependent oxidoreductase, partial [Reyranella sp.]